MTAPFLRRGTLLAGMAGAAVLALGSCSLEEMLPSEPPTGSPAPDTSASASQAPSGEGAERARERLAELEIAPEGASADYDREDFEHWSSIEGNCNAREMVLERDGDGVETGRDCYPTSGSWESRYDGETLDDPADVSVDHFVPLAEAWRSGADGWDEDRREAFANDLSGDQLWAVSTSSNSSKSDRDPAEWMPSDTEIHCKYTVTWIEVKHTWELTVDQEEHDALSDLLDTAC